MGERRAGDIELSAGNASKMRVEAPGSAHSS